MKIQEIYTQYKIMPSLQLHMLRVSSVAQVICESINKSVILVSEERAHPESGSTSSQNDDIKNIISACLLHDMGNILKFNMDLFPEFLQPEGKEYWEKIKDEFETKYGTDEHEATIAICHEIGVGKRIIELVQAFQFASAKINYETNDFGKKICTYSDMRVEPFGVVTLAERLRDGRVRYKHNKKHLNESEQFYLEMSGYLKKIEEQISSKSSITPDVITDIKVITYINKLKTFEIA